MRLFALPMSSNPSPGEIELTLAGDGLDPDLVRRLVAIINAGCPLGGFEDGELQPIPFVEISPEPSPAP